MGQGTSAKVLASLITYLFLATLPLVISLLIRDATKHGFFHEVGRNLGLVGFSLLILQFALAARFKFFDRWVPFNSSMIFHRSMAMIALVFLIVHPVVIAAGHGKWDLIISLDKPLAIWAGRLALVFLLLLVSFSIFRKKLGIPYQLWRSVHGLTAALIIALAFFHSWYVGKDLEFFGLQLLWILFGGASVFLITRKKMLLPKQLSKEPYRVCSIVKESSDVYTLEFELDAPQKTDAHLPGQFHFVRLKGNSDISRRSTISPSHLLQETRALFLPQ